MDKAFDFVKNLRPSFIEMFGYPVLDFYSDYCEVRFSTSNTIRSLDFLLECPADEFRMYGGIDNTLNIVFTFEY